MPDKDWFNDLLSSGKYSMMQSFLEPQAELTFSKLAKNTQALDNMVYKGKIHTDALPGFYIYEQEDQSGMSQFGIWTLTCVEDYRNGMILAHEQTLSEHAERLRLYRENVGLEANPVLLTYPRNQTLSSLIEFATVLEPDHTFSIKGTKHSIWAITDKGTQEQMTAAFSEITKVCIADGHHRLEAAASGSCRDKWISTLYVSCGQLSSKAFHRMVLPSRPVRKESFFLFLSTYFKIFESGENLPVKPDRAGQLGLYFQKRWYKLEFLPGVKDQPDVSLLQENILATYFEIEDPRTDSRLKCWPDTAWMGMINVATGHPEGILFTLFSISAQRLLDLAISGQQLPPKSTYIQPRVPYGLLMHRTETKARYAY